MATTDAEDAIRFRSRSDETGLGTHNFPAADPITPIETALRAAVDRMAKGRIYGRYPRPDLEDLANQLIEEVIRDEHMSVLCGSEDAANPTAQEHRWAQSIAGAVARRFQRTSRKVLRQLKGEVPAPIVDTTRDADGCPAWCANHASGRACDWHESKPISLQGPGDMYDENPEPCEVLWAAISEVPQDDIDAGVQPGAYIFFDTLATGQGDRLNVDQADALIEDLTRYVTRLQGLRDQLSALNATEAGDQ